MNKFAQWVRKPDVWGFFVSVIIMAVISIFFFFPDNFEGNSLRQADMQQGAANGQEAKLFFEQTGEKALWTNSLFGGMPTFQISPSYPSNSLFTWLNSVYGLGLPAPSNLLFMMMFGFFIMLCVMNLRWYYALIGAIAWGFSSYFIIIIGAGHIWKFVTLTYIPPTIGGLILCYRGRFLAGAAMTAVFAMLQLNANHPQMSYYFAFVMVALVIAWLVEAIKTKQVRRWVIATVVSLGAGALAISANLPSLYNTYEYAKETKRAQSELAQPTDENVVTSPENRPTGGMPRDQILGWSYGRTETLSLLIPNIKGGASAKPEKGRMIPMGLDRLDEADQYSNTSATNLLPYLSQYFNNSEGTNGPVYVGAVIFALFLLGCVIVKGPIKWALVVSTILSIMLAWGINFEWLSDLMIYNFPLYNKFRAVESILVIAEFTMPLLAILALKELFTSKDSIKKYKLPIYITFGICLFICLLVATVPSVVGDAITDVDRQTVAGISEQLAQMGQSQGASPAEIQRYIYEFSLSNPSNINAVESLRYELVSDDALRSFLLILAAGIVLMICLAGKCGKAEVVSCIGVLILVDLFSINHRYVDSDSFVAVAQDAPEFTPDAIDNAILADTTLHYRVMDVPGFNQPNRSFFHKTLGGYHAAKLNRYEDIIQRHLNNIAHYDYIPELRYDSIIAQYPAEYHEPLRRVATSYRIMDMLNARYVITKDKSAPVMINSFALGNAWFVNKLNYVDNAHAEMNALNSLNPSTEAVADKRFEEILGVVKAPTDSADYITLTGYTPNTLTYHSNSKNGGIGVFSEVWFPWGWKATIDGTPANIGRVNYILRAMQIPAGEHEIVMTFAPDSIQTTTNVAYASISAIYLLIILALFFEYRRQTKSEQ